MPSRFSFFLLLYWVLVSPTWAAPTLEIKILAEPNKEGEVKLLFANAELRFLDSVGGKTLQKRSGIVKKKPVSIQAPEGAQAVEVIGYCVGYESQRKTLILEETGVNLVELRLRPLKIARFRVLDEATLGRIDQAKILYKFKLSSGHSSQRTVRTIKGQGITDVPLKAKTSGSFLFQAPGFQDKTLTLDYEEASRDIIRVYLKPH